MTDHQEITVCAGMPGRIVRVCVRPGDEVSEGSALGVLGSMKMEQPVSAPADGRVAGVLTREGADVRTGEVLFRIAVR